MAVSPQDVFRLDQSELDIVEKMESRIDKQLRSQCGKECISVRMSAKDFPNRRVRNELMRRYKMAGWEVEFLPCSIDGEKPGFRFYPEEGRAYLVL